LVKPEGVIYTPKGEYIKPLQAVPVGCGRFISSGLTVAPSGRDRASRGLLSWPLLSPMERGASTLEERGFLRICYYDIMIL
jgi:hypothetical protein